MSKSKLIEIIADQANRFHIMQDINKSLLEQIKTLKGKSGEKNEDD